MDFSELEFNKKAHELFTISEALNDNWTINEKHENIYLSKKQTISMKSTQKPLVVEIDDDISVARNPVGEDIISIEYHVLFHPSYQVPVLYFNALSDQKLIALQDLSNIFVDKFEFKSSHDEMRNIITQGEHPILFRPFSMLHPCKVRQVLSQFPGSKNFILTYLTLFGPSIRLKMSTDYDKFLTEKEISSTM